MSSRTLFLVAAIATLAIAVSGARLGDEVYTDLFKQFVRSHGKDYHPTEVSQRFNIFKTNYDAILAHNEEADNGKHTYWLGINQFTDMTTEEFSRMMLGSRRVVDNSVPRKAFVYSNATAPDSWDWRDHNAVTPVKNQGQCGSCWSFSTTGSMEGAHAIKTGKLVSLSESQLVDCSQSYGNMGCNGGLMDNAFKYIIAVGGLESEDEYPYVAQDGSCKFDKSKIVASISSYVDVPTHDEDAMKQALTVNPLSVAINAASFSFQSYSHGVYSDKSCPNGDDQLDHGVLTVGYGTTDDGTDYWLVKNSWGATWGDSGYLKMLRGANQCGISDCPSYPVV